jgi:hypothetical protein
MRRGSALALALVLTSTAVVASQERPALASSSTTYDFNTVGDLARYFNGTGPGQASVSEAVDGGIGDSGSIRVPLSAVDAVYTSREGYSLGPVGSTYTFSTFLKSEGNSGYSGVGFTIASPATTGSPSAFRPNDAFGISVHGGGFIFHNGDEDSFGDWGGGWQSPGITAVKTSTACSDLINNTTTECGSPDKWFKTVFVVQRTSETEFDLRVEVWPSNVDGTLRETEASAIFALNGVTNAAILDAPQLFSYFSFSGVRVTRFDDYTVTLSGGATAVAEGFPVVVTKAVQVVGNPTVALEARVAFDGGSSVTERGFVWSSSQSPTVADTKVPLGAGVGDYSGTTALPASGTYFFRSYATNATGTSYGAETSVEYVSNSPVPPLNPGSNSGPNPESGSDLTVGLSGVDSLLVRDGAVEPTTTTLTRSAGPRGGLVIEDESGSLRVTVTGDGGVTQDSGVIAAPDGEIVCEICAQLAAGLVVEAWIYSTPRLAAAVRVDVEDGICPLLRIPVGAPLDGAGPIAPGRHTLQLRMITDAGYEILSIPITIGTSTGRAAGAPVPTRVNTGGGPVPIMPLPLALGLLIATAGLLLIQRERQLAWAYAWATRPRRTRTIPGRRLTAFDTLAQQLDTFRQEQRH